MSDDQQTARARFRGEPDHLDHSSVGGVEAVSGGVEFARGDGGELVADDGVHDDAVDHRCSGDRSCRSDRFGPVSDFVAVQPRSQHVVAVEHRLHGAIQHVGVDRRRQLQQGRLRVATEVLAPPQHPLHDRSERQVADSPARKFLEHDDVGGAAELGDLGERRDGLALEDVPRRDDQSGRLRTRHQLDRHDAVAAEREERVVDADRVETEHLGEQRCEPLLDRGSRRSALRDTRREVRGRQCATVELAVGGERQLVDHEERRGNHVGRKRRADELEHGRRFDGAARFGHDVADESISCPVVTDRHDRLGHPVEVRQRRLDLTEFDAESVQLDLCVAAAEVFEAPVTVPARGVAGAVHARTGGGLRIGDETGRRQRGAAEVTAGELCTRDVHLTRDTRRNEPQAVVANRHGQPR
ncbi:hypothetical protein RhoFasB10_03716 [Rhodococcus sp. B10]|nr:hypothetical protein [Rhodococcus sp. B10]